MSSFATEKKQRRYYALDIIKAISILLVLIWHLQPIQFVGINTDSSILIKLLNKGILVFYREITLIAVPSFYLVSLYLFFQKTKSKTDQYIRQRSLKVLNIFIVWSLIQTLIYFFAKYIIQDDRLNNSFLSSYSSIWHTFRMGGPSIPIAGDSVFYFLFNLMVLYVLSYLLLKVQEKVNIENKYILLAIIVFSVILFETKGSSIEYFDILNFFIYIPIAACFASTDMAEIKQKYATKKVIFLVFLLFIFLICKNQLLGGGGVYSRSSLAVGSVLLFFTAFYVEEFYIAKRNQKIVMSLSAFSLGLFALHKYWQYAMSLFFERYFNIGFQSIYYFDVMNFIQFLFAVLLTFFSCFILSKFNIFKSYIR